MARLKSIPVTAFALMQVAIGVASHHLDEGVGQVLAAAALTTYIVALALRIRWLAIVMLVTPPVIGLLTRAAGLEYNWRAGTVIAVTIAIAIALDVRERKGGSDGSATALDAV